MKKRDKVVVPKTHPPAWGSALWPHVELIRDMRRRRKKWADITIELERQYGIKLSLTTVRNFFARATNPKRRRPLGFEDAPSPPSPPPHADAPSVLPPPPRPEDPFSVDPEAPRPAALFEKTRKRLEQQRLEQEKQT
jgi:hypothetical protein